MNSYRLRVLPTPSLVSSILEPQATVAATVRKDSIHTQNLGCEKNLSRSIDVVMRFQRHDAEITSTAESSFTYIGLSKHTPLLYALQKGFFEVSKMLGNGVGSIGRMMSKTRCCCLGFSSLASLAA